MRLERMWLEGADASHAVRVLATPWERMRGLLGRGRNTLPVVLEPCASVHTLGMRHALDLAFLAEDGTVVAAERDVPPGRLRSCRGAFAVLERPASNEVWPHAGERVRRQPLGR